MERQFIVHSSSIETLYFKSLKGDEKLSEAYSFEIELLSDKRLIDPIALHNTPLTLEIKTPSKQTRYLNGYIEKISYTPFHKYEDRLYLYTATVIPKLCELKKNLGYSIWQEKTVPEIITDVLNNAGINFENKLFENYRKWEYCVKYNETDFDFIHRLMAHEGIYYYFEHIAGNQIMMLVDAPLALHPLLGYEAIDYQNNDLDLVDEYYYECITEWNVNSTTIPCKFSTDDYDFRQPRAELQNAVQASHNTVNNTEMFMWPGHFVKSEQGQFYANVRQKEAEANSKLINGKGNVLGMAPGHTFLLVLPKDLITFANILEDQCNYSIVGVNYEIYGDEFNYDCIAGKLRYKNVVGFNVIPANVQWKPPATTPWPKVTGIETAVVTGPKDKPIWTDKYGRIKVKFRWDKSDTKDDTSSCWIRVATRWAGWRYGAINVPRVGEEVVISFVSGDPDKPFVIGSAYNDENMPPWELPEHETRSGVMSNTKEGKHEQANYMYMDDTPDKELFDLHAEKDMNISVEHDMKTTVDHDVSTSAGHDMKVYAKRNMDTSADHDMKVAAKHDMSTSAGHDMGISADHNMKVSSGRNMKVSVGRSLNTTVENNNHVTIKGLRKTLILKEQKDTVTGAADFKYKDNRDTLVKGKDKLTVEAGQENSIKKGRNTEIKGDDVYKLTGNQKSTITGDWELKVTGNMAFHVPGSITLETDSKVNIISALSIMNSKLHKFD
ncbi:MAG: type VI secretion system tip protein VgrG [Enterobacteriaceae bacterium]|jgi:type VI secretion system secreted protein VgrG|nr:type VI secretion system tip protein VgrG [Enterobacteriaceae bacterium]